MKLFDKIKWVSGVLLVFVIVLATNLIDKDNFNRLKDSITTIYEDRIVASDILFELSTLVHERELLLIAQDSNAIANNKTNFTPLVEEYINQYENTKLTVDEKTIFNQLKENLQSYSTLTQVQPQLSSAIKNNLHELSKIQVDEGQRQMKMSAKTMESINLFTQIEVIFLVIIALLVQIIILYQPKTK